MTSLGRKQVVSVMVPVACALLLSGCAARTRLGALIPAHVKSEQIEGELITAHYLRIKTPAPTPAPTPKTGAQVTSLTAGAALAVPIAGFLVDVAASAVRSALAEEADRYEHSYSARLLLTTADLDSGGVIVVIRWVNDSTKSTISLVPPPPEQFEAFEETQLENAIENLKTKIPGKKPAAIMTMRVSHDTGDGPVYRLSGARVSIESVSAKVVDYGWKNKYKVWELFGAAVFDTDSQATFMPTMKVKGLITSKEDKNAKVIAAEWVEIAPDAPVLSPKTNVDLDKLPGPFELGTSTGAWLFVPTIEVGQDVIRQGFVVMDFAFTESDASNARKYALKGVNYIDENKETWKKQAEAGASRVVNPK